MTIEVCPECKNVEGTPHERGCSLAIGYDPHVTDELTEAWERAERERLAAHRVDSAALMAKLTAAKAKHGNLTIVVDNDCWRASLPGYPREEDYGTPEAFYAAEDRHCEQEPRGDEAPTELAILFAIALGYDAEQP